MSDVTIPYIAPVHVFVHQTPNNQFQWEAVVSGHGDAKYIYGDTRMEVMLKVCQALGNKP